MKTLTVKVAGATYQIPEMWLVGITTGPLKLSYREAVQWWHDQECMERAS